MSVDLASVMRLEAENALYRALGQLNLIAREEGVTAEDQARAKEAAESTWRAMELLKTTKFDDAPSIRFMRKRHRIRRA